MAIYRVSAQFAGQTITRHFTTLLPTLLGHAIAIGTCVGLMRLRPAWVFATIAVLLMVISSGIIVVMRWHVFHICTEPERVVVRCATLLFHRRIFPAESIVQIDLHQTLLDLCRNTGTLTITTSKGVWIYSGLTPYKRLCDALR